MVVPICPHHSQPGAEHLGPPGLSSYLGRGRGPGARAAPSCLLEEGLQLEELRNCPVDTLPGDARRVFALFLLFFFFK